MKFRNEYLLLGIPFCAALLFWGSMYSYGVLFTGVILAILFIIRTKQTGKCILYKNKIIYGSFLLAVPALISVWTGIDKGMSFYGFLRVAVLLGWLLFLMQFSDADRFFY